MDLNNFKVKLTGYDAKAKRTINFYVEPEKAEKATQDPKYKEKLVEEAIESLNKQLKEIRKKNTIAKVVPLELSDGKQDYTLYVTPADYDLAQMDMQHAQKLLDRHQKVVVEQLSNTVTTNFVQDDLTSVPSGSKVMMLAIYDDASKQTYHVTVTPEEHERALDDKEYAMALLRSYKKATNFPLNADDPLDDNEDDIIIEEDPLQDENNLNVGNVSCVSKVCPKKKNKSTKAAQAGNQRAIWPEKCVRCLLELYKQYIERYDTGKLTYNKLWALIQQEMEDNEYKYTIQQCINKLDSLKRKYKEVMDHNSQTGTAPITCEYYDELNDLFHKKPWIKPLSTAGSNITLDMDDIEAAHHKSKKAKVSGSALKAQFIKETLDFQKQRLEIERKKLELEADYKKNKLEILKKFSGQN